MNYGPIYRAEVATDWEHKFSPELSVKLVGLATGTGTEQADTFQTIRAIGGLTNTQYIDRKTETGERLGRASLTWRPSGDHTVEAGIEAAFNFRDANLAIANDAGSGRVPAVLPVADTLVEELRGEAFVTDVWKMTPTLTLETGFTFEASQITQTGDAQQEREFTYPKPRAILTWQLDPSNQLRASVIRDVAQLDFAEFASSVAVIDNLTTFGNPNLEPEKTWKGRLEWEQRFTPKMALTISLFRDDVSDTQDLIPLSLCAGPGSVEAGTCGLADIRTLDGAGNIGRGKRTGIETRFGAPLDFLGIPNAEIRFTGKLQETSVTDPVTEETLNFRWSKLGTIMPRSGRSCLS
ncbi:MAG: TonB-dependent receptor [Hyphomonadaceae bacterium]|nr:TonB-dependent receptor [Hyphomonadaceae bacterium]